MANDLRLKLLLDAVDRATAPLRRIDNESQSVGRTLRDTRDRMRELNAQQRDVGAWREQHAQARKTAQSLEEAKEKVKQLARTMASSGPPTQQMTAEFQAAIRAAAALKQQHTQQQDALRGLQGRLSAAGIDTRNLNQHQQALRQEMQQANNTIEQQEARLRQLAVMQRRAAEARERLDRSQSRAASMAGTGAAGVATGTAMAMAGASLVMPQMEVAQQGSMIAAQNGESSDRSNQYAGLMRNIRTDGLSTDMQEIGTAVAAVKSTLGALGEVSDKSLDGAARKALDLSKVMGLDVTESIQMVGIMMQNGLAGSSDEAFDLITAGLQKIPMAMRDEIPEILHEYSTHFRSMGLSGNEAMSLLVDMSKQGKFALDKTGDAIKEFSIRGSDMSKTSQEAYKSLGLNAEKMSSAIAKGGPEAKKAMQATAKALLKIKDPAERANAAISLFGTPIEDLSVDQIPAFLEKLTGTAQALGDTAGAADKMGKTFRDNLSGDIDKLTGAWGALLGSLMEGQDGPLRGLVQTVTEIIGTVREWIGANPELAASLAKGAAIVAVLIAGMGALTVALASVLGPFAMIRYGMTLFSLTGAGLLPTLGRLAMAFGGPLIVAIRAVGLALWGLAANPVVLAIAAVVAVIASAAYLIYRNWEQIEPFFTATWSAIRSTFSTALTGLLSLLARINPMPMLSQAWDAVKLYFVTTWSEISATFSTALAGLLSLLMQFNPMAVLSQVWGSVTTYFTNSWSQIKTGFSGGITGILTTLASFSPLQLIYQAFASVLSYLGIDLPTRFTEFGGMIVSGLINGLLGGLGAIQETMSKLGDSTIGWFKEKLDIHSPSRVFAELGGFTTGGLALGLNAGAKEPLEAVARMGQQMAQASAMQLAVPQINTPEADRPPVQLPSLSPALEDLQRLRGQFVAPALQPQAANDANPAQPVRPELARPPIQLPQMTPALEELQRLRGQFAAPALQPQAANDANPAQPVCPELVRPPIQLTQMTPVLENLQQLRSQVAQSGARPLQATLPQVAAIPSAPAVNGDRITMDNRPPISAAAPPVQDSHDTYTITIQTSAGMDPQAIARAVSAELDRRDREKSARQRSRLSDQE